MCLSGTFINIYVGFSKFRSYFEIFRKKRNSEFLLRIHAWQTYAWSSVTHAWDHPRSTEEKKHSHIYIYIHILYIIYII
jgi:hypothetical protein